MSDDAEWIGDIRDDGPLHALWTKAKDHPDYDKSEWIALERKLSQRNCADVEHETVQRIVKWYASMPATARTEAHLSLMEALNSSIVQRLEAARLEKNALVREIETGSKENRAVLIQRGVALKREIEQLENQLFSKPGSDGALSR